MRRSNYPAESIESFFTVRCGRRRSRRRSRRRVVVVISYRVSRLLGTAGGVAGSFLATTKAGGDRIYRRSCLLISSCVRSSHRVSARLIVCLISSSLNSSCDRPPPPPIRIHSEIHCRSPISNRCFVGICHGWCDVRSLARWYSEVTGVVWCGVVMWKRSG